MSRNVTCSSCSFWLLPQGVMFFLGTSHEASELCFVNCWLSLNFSSYTNPNWPSRTTGFFSRTLVIFLYLPPNLNWDDLNISVHQIDLVFAFVVSLNLETKVKMWANHQPIYLLGENVKIEPCLKQLFQVYHFPLQKPPKKHKNPWFLPRSCTGHGHVHSILGRLGAKDPSNTWGKCHWFFSTAANQWQNSEVIKLTSQPLGNIEVKKSMFDLLT